MATVTAHKGNSDEAKGTPPIGEITDTATKRLTEYKRRSGIYVQRSFSLDEGEQALSQGWELVRENKSSLRLKKLRPIEEQLENDFWCLLYNLGYQILNVGKNFYIEIVSEQDRTVSKQIDVFGYDDETIIIAECKSCERRTKRSLQKDIGEFVSIQRSAANSLRKHFGRKFTQKIVWLFVTKNTDWSENDRARAREGNIKIITERELFYYKEIAKRLGHTARYQFHAEFLARSKVTALQDVKVFAIRTKLGAFRTYTFFAPAKKILPITFINHRDLRDPNAVPSYQRLLQRPRLKQIADFIKSGGFFPNSIILNFKQRVRFETIKAEDSSGTSVGTLFLPNTYKSAWIIDGQHRMYGYAEIETDDEAALLPFLAFESINISEETRLFSDINSKQKRVEKKLLDEITGEIKLESADRREQIRAIASRVFDMMRDDDSGPLGGKITGVEIKHSESSILTIPYLVDAVVYSGVLGRVAPKDGKNTFIQGPLQWDEPREAIDGLVELLTEYFSLYRTANPDRWEAGRAGGFVTNPGAAGMLRFLADLIDFMAKQEHEEPRTLHPKAVVERIEKYLEPCLTFLKDASDTDVEKRFKVPFGSGGPKIFQHRLRELTATQFKNFNPLGFEDDMRRYSVERTERADRTVRAIQESVHGYVVRRLKEVYGPGDDYLERAIENREILKKAYEKRLEADEKDRKDMGTYFDFLDLRKIVESPKNWNWFSDKLNIKLPEERKGKAKYVTWFDEVNKVRRIPAHPYNRGYSDEEFQTLEMIFNNLSASGIIQSGH